MIRWGHLGERFARGLLLGVLVAAFAACEPRGLLTQSELAGPYRGIIVQSCCDCLALAKQDIPHPLQGCAQDYPAGFNAPASDAGIPQDLPTLRSTTRCLCDDVPNADTCATRLNTERSIALVGRCVEPGGVCESSCEGVLAFP